VLDGSTTILHQTFTLDARYGITTPQLLEHVNQVATLKAAQAGEASYGAALAEGAVQQQRRATLGNG
jgi:hypothetical protein